MAVKVCHITNMHKPFDGRIFLKQCISLSSKYDVSLIQGNTEDQERNGVIVYGIPTPSGRFKRMMTRKPFLKKALEVDADIYQIHDPELLSLIPKLKKRGKKVIFDSHENFPGVIMTKEYLPFFIRRIVSKVYERYERKMLKYCDALFSVTPDIVSRLSRINKHAYLITNYPLYHETEDNRKWGKSICFAGGVVREWMHHQIIKALPETNVTYRVVGGVAYPSYLESLKSLSGWNSVVFEGNINHEDVNSFLQENSAGMALYTYDDPNVNYKEGTLGNQKLFEYMMAGIPIITSHLRLWEQVINENDCGLVVEPEDIHSISKAINYLINNPEDAKRMGDNAHRAVKEKYNWKTQEGTLFQAYEYVNNL